MCARKSIQAEVEAIAAAFEGRTVEQSKLKRKKHKPVVCEAAYIGDQAEWNYMERTYDLLAEFGVIRPLNTLES